MTIHKEHSDGPENFDWFALGFSRAEIAMGLLTAEGRWHRVNPALCRMLGYAETELAGLHFNDITFPADREKFEAANRELVEGRTDRFELERRYVRRDGSVVWGQVVGSPIRSQDGGIRFYMAVMHDISARKAIEDRLRESEERYRLLTEESPEPLMVHRDGVVCYMNRACMSLGETLFGKGAMDDAVGRPILEILLPGDREPVGKRLMREGREPVSPPEEIRLTGTTGCTMDIELRSIVVRFDGREAIRTVFRDITRSKKLERRARFGEARYRSLMAYHLDAVYAFDPEGRFTELNPVCEEISGYRPEELLGRSFQVIVGEESLEQCRVSFQQALHGEGSKMEIVILHKSGHPVDLQISTIPIIVDGEVVGVYGVAKDITEQKRAEISLKETNRLLRDLSVLDGLTGLTNRRRFDELYAASWEQVTAGVSGMALIALDIDRFKAYNDHYGHLGGDEALRSVSAIIREEAGEAGGTAARYGGEEFMIVLSGGDSRVAVDTSERIRRRVEELGISHCGMEPPGIVTISVGVAVRRPGEGGGRSELIEQADRALYRSKLEGRNRVTLYEPALLRRPLPE